MTTYLKESIRPIVRRLVEEAWEVREGEKFLIVSDYPTPEDFVNKPTKILESIVERSLLAKRLYECIQELAPCETELYLIKPTYEHYKDPEDEKLTQKVNESDIVLTLTEYSLTDVPTLAIPREQKKIRHISAPLVPADIFYPDGPLDVDLHEIERLTTKLFSLIQGARKLEFFDIAGSYLSLEFNEPIDWLWESGFVTSGGMFSNLPAGEVTLELPYLSEICKINGTLNIFPGWSEELTQLLTLNFKDGRLVDVVGGGQIIGDHIKEMILSEDVRIIQMGIGTNPQAKDPFCSTVADKFIGMVHIALHPDTRVDHYYFPMSKIRINEKEYTRNELFETKNH